MLPWIPRQSVLFKPFLFNVESRVVIFDRTNSGILGRLVALRAISYYLRGSDTWYERILVVIKILIRHQIFPIDLFFDHSHVAIHFHMLPRLLLNVQHLPIIILLLSLLLNHHFIIAAYLLSLPVYFTIVPIIGDFQI